MTSKDRTIRPGRKITGLLRKRAGLRVRRALRLQAPPPESDQDASTIVGYRAYDARPIIRQAGH